jgi:hypothetical protein
MKINKFVPRPAPIVKSIVLNEAESRFIYDLLGNMSDNDTERLFGSECTPELLKLSNEMYSEMSAVYDNLD